MDLREQLQGALGSAYELERELGGGGMSRVFVAEERAFRRKVVVKILSPELAAGVSNDRFAREIRLAAQLQQANIVPLITAGDANGLPYYTMPFVDGESLKQRLATGGPLLIGETVNVLRDVARALAYAHDRGVAHRDIKPENVLLSGDAAVVTDFGIAKALSASRSRDGSETLTSVGMAVGTPGYMAPEQASGDPATDHRADIYAFGCLAFELLSGAPPFPGRTPQQTLAAHVHEAPPAIETIRRDVPSTLATLVGRCLNKDPGARPQSARELLSLLDTVPSTSGRMATLNAGWPAWAIAGAVAAVGVVALGAFALARERRSGGPIAPRTLAVMPFANVGADTARQYFADGIAIDLTNALGKVPGLQVASHSLAFMYQGKSIDVRTVGRELRVDAVVEGTVQRSADRIRVTTQLTRTRDGVALWSDAYERQAQDLFAVQDDITRSILGELRLTLAGRAPGASGKPNVAGTSDFEAYDSYLRGIYLLEHRGPGVAKSLDYFADAIAKDSGFARAYGALSEGLELMPYFSATPATAVESRAVAAAQRALALDSSVVDAHIGLALAHEHAFHWQEGEREYLRALAFDSMSAVAHLQYGRHLMHTARIPEALAQFRRATELDPVSGTAYVWLAHMYSLSGQHDSALVIARRSREIDPGLALGRTIGAMDAIDANRPDEARALVESFAGPPPWRGQAAYSLGASGDTAAARAVIRDLVRLPRDTWLLHTGLAYAYLGVRDTSRALSELEAALAAHEITPKWSPMAGRAYDSIRRSPRFAAVVRGFGLDEKTLTSPTGGRPAR